MKNTEKQITVTFKYKPEEKVWIIHENKAKQFPVHSLKCDIEKSGITSSVYLNIGNKDNFQCKIVKEDYCFKTKQELIDSL